ncbi:MAG: nitroreductase [Candidatus Thiodiazotropha sp.]
MSSQSIPQRKMPDKTIVELLDERISTRAFLDKPVSKEVLEQILRESAKSPSGSNMQPWKVYVLTGEKKADLTNTVKNKIAAGKTEDSPEIAVYPEKLKSPYRERRYKCGMALYGALGISKEDTAERKQRWIANFEFFDAPVAMIFTLDKQMGCAQYLDLGIFLQSIMLLAQDFGLNTCPLLSWSAWPQTIREVVGIEQDETAICAMALGYGDVEHAVNQYRTERCELHEYTEFYGFD